MRDLFVDTLAAHIIRIVSKNHLCALPDLEVLVVEDKSSNGLTAFTEDERTPQPPGSASNVEKGPNVELVSWNGLDDPAVSQHAPHPCDNYDH